MPRWVRTAILIVGMSYAIEWSLAEGLSPFVGVVPGWLLAHLNSAVIGLLVAPLVAMVSLLRHRRGELGLWQFNRDRRRAGRGFPPWLRGVAAALGLSLMVGGCVWIGHAVARHIMREMLNEELSGVAVLAAQRIDSRAHAALKDPAQQNGPEYQAVVAPLRAMLAVSPRYRYMYTMRQSPEGLRFVVDASDPVDSDGDGVIDQATLAELYPDPDAASLEAIRKGKPAVSPEPKSDKWGTFISAFAPVFAEDGKLECIVGVDSTADVYFTRLDRVNRAAELALIVGVLASSGAGLGVALLDRRRLIGEAALATNEARVRAVIDTALDAVVSMDAKGLVVSWNKQAEITFGWKSHEAIGRPMAELIIPPECRQAHEQGLRRFLQSGVGKVLGQRIEVVAMHKDGSRLEVELAISTAPTEAGPMFSAFLRDISPRKAAENALRDATSDAKRLAAAIDAHADMVFLTSAQGRIVRVNPAFERISGYTAAEAIGKFPSMLKSGRTTGDTYRELWSTILSGHPWHGRLCNARRSGSADVVNYWVEASITPILRPGGELDGFVAVERDVTAQVLSEQEEQARIQGADIRVRVAKALAQPGPIAARLSDAVDAAMSFAGLHVRGCGGVYLRTENVLTLACCRGALSAEFQRTRSLVKADEWLLGRLAIDGQAIRGHAGEIGLAADDDGASGVLIVPLMDRSVSPASCQGALFLRIDPDSSIYPACLSALEEIGELMAVAVLQDRAARLAEAARVRAEEASRMKSDFLANMSHEIRTPMTAILGYAELLAEDGDRSIAPAARLEHIDTIKRNGQHLLSLINDILDLSKIEAGKMTVERIPTSPEQILLDVLSLMQVKAKDRSIGLAVDWESPLPRTIQSDPVRLKQILVNIVGNAIKFTDAGQVRVGASLISEPGQRPMLRFEVVDTGIGLSPAQISGLFTAFGQADSSTTRKFGGTGLGLRISRTLAQMLGGDVSVSSSLGCGSTFTITVDPGPLDGVEMIPPEEAGRALTLPPEPRLPAASTDRPLEGLRIYVAEDGVDNQRLLRFHLTRAGAQVSVFDNGLLCLRALSADGSDTGPLHSDPPCDLVITDMQMPDMDGYTLARILRNKGWKGRIIALTAHAMAGDAEKCLASGCDGYATKPIERAKLIDICANRRAAA